MNVTFFPLLFCVHFYAKFFDQMGISVNGDVFAVLLLACACSCDNLFVWRT